MCWWSCSQMQAYRSKKAEDQSTLTLRSRQDFDIFFNSLRLRLSDPLLIYFRLELCNQSYCLLNLPQSDVLSEMLLSFFFTYLLSPPLSVCEKLHKLFSYCFPCKMSFICGLYVNDNLAVLHLSPWLYIVSSDFTNAKSQ